MTPKELADQLTGSEYPFRLSNELLMSADKHGLVVVYGASDDLIELEGAINDECGAAGGEEVRFDSKGLEQNFDTLCDDYDREGLKEFFSREAGMRTITPLWCEEKGYSWTYVTDIPHATFEIVEDGEPYCRGIVFRLSDINQATSP